MRPRKKLQNPKSGKTNKRWLSETMALSFLITTGVFFTMPWENFFKSSQGDELAAETAWLSPLIAIKLELKNLQKSVQQPSPELATMGRQIFFDKQMSANGQISCGTCHDPKRAFTDGKPLAIGLSIGTRHTPTLLNTAFSPWLLWDGRATHLGSQALGPLENPLEHGISRFAAVQLAWQKYPELYAAESSYDVAEALGWMLSNKTKIADKDYATDPAAQVKLDPFLSALAVASLDNLTLHHSIISQAARLGLSPGIYFSQTTASKASLSPPLPIPISSTLDKAFQKIGLAIGAYVATLQDFSSPFDAFALSFDPEKPVEQAFSQEFTSKEFSGLKIFFGKASCHTCHRGARFTDDEFHNIGLADRADDWRKIDLGRALGIYAAEKNAFNCDRERASLPACEELPYTNKANPETLGAFKTPTLRFLKETAPYMHNGTLPTLESVINHYQTLPGQATIGHRSELLKPLNLTKNEQDDLIAFLKSLSSNQWPH